MSTLVKRTVITNGTSANTLGHHTGGDSHISAVEFIDKKSFADRSVNP